LSLAGASNQGDFDWAFQLDQEQKMIRKIILAVFVLVLALSLPMSVSANNGKGNNPKSLGEAGWFCFNVPGLGVHCAPPGKFFGDKTIPLKYFDTDDVNAENAVYLGTEILVHESIYNGQPCPQEGLDQYFQVIAPGGLVYYACHRR
jgi:hypothetical protein